MIIPRNVNLVKELFIMNRSECRTQYVSFFERRKKLSRCHSSHSFRVSCSDIEYGYRYTETKVISSLQMFY